MPFLSNQQCQSTEQQQQQPFYGPLFGTTRVSRYQKKHSPTHHPDHHPFFISFFHLPRCIASSLFKLRAWQSFCTTTSLLVYLLVWSPPPHTSYISSPNQHLLFATHARSIATCFAVVLSIPSLSLNSLLGTLSFTLKLHIHLTILISTRRSEVVKLLKEIHKFTFIKYFF